MLIIIHILILAQSFSDNISVICQVLSVRFLGFVSVVDGNERKYYNIKV